MTAFPRWGVRRPGEGAGWGGVASLGLHVALACMLLFLPGAQRREAPAQEGLEIVWDEESPETVGEGGNPMEEAEPPMPPPSLAEVPSPEPVQEPPPPSPPPMPPAAPRLAELPPPSPPSPPPVPTAPPQLAPAAVPSPLDLAPPPPVAPEPPRELAALPPPPAPDPPPREPTPEEAPRAEAEPEPALEPLAEPPVLPPQPPPPEPARPQRATPPPRQQATARPAAPPGAAAPAPNPGAPDPVGQGRALGPTSPPAPDERFARAAPPYPEMSRLRGEQGVVVLELAIGTDGRVVTVRVARSSGFGALDEAARRAAQDWRFRPALIEGQPTLATVQTSVQFRLQ